MPQIIKKYMVMTALALVCLLSLAGCGDGNPQATFDPAIGTHPDGWLPTGHKSAALAKIDNCTQCHGADFLGGVSKVACTQCHLGNQRAVHPEQWGQFAYALHGSYVEQNGFARCATAVCHGTDMSGVAGSGPSCTSCHMGGNLAVHPTTWVPLFTTAPGISPTILPDHADYVSANGSARCSVDVCHGSGGVGVFLSGRSCMACHV